MGDLDDASFLPDALELCVTGRRDVNREDWKTIDAWLDAVLASLPAQPLKTAAELSSALAGPGQCVLQQRLKWFSSLAMGKA